MMRVHEFEGNIYVIRDMKDFVIWGGGPESQSSRTRCEYAVRDHGGERWLPCEEGVLFKDIEPYCTVKEWYQPMAQARIAAIMNARAA